MEDTLRARFLVLVVRDEDCLNPCCNGRYSQRSKVIFVSLFSIGLNPCCNGRYSQRARHTNPLYKRDWYL